MSKLVRATIYSISLVLICCGVTLAKEINLTLEDGPLTITKGHTVTKKVIGIPAGTPGTINLNLKWHAMTFIPNVFEKLKIEVLHGSTVILTKQCYSIHADKEPKCYLFPMSSNDATEFTRSGDWKIRVTNISTNDVNGFNVRKEATDLNLAVPNLPSTFEANCSERYLGFVGAPVSVAPYSSVERDLFGMTFGPGAFRIRAKWHTDVITPNVFQRLKVEILYNGSVVATDYGYSIHSNEKDKLDLKYASGGGDVFKWRIRITNDTGLKINDFNVEKGGDLNPFVPSFKSTFLPQCN